MENKSLEVAIKELSVKTKYIRTNLNQTIQKFFKLKFRDAEKGISLSGSKWLKQ